MFPFNFFKKENKTKFVMAEEELEHHLTNLSIMKGKKYTCIAMWELTHETIYKVALQTIKKAIKMLKKVVKGGTRSYSKGGRRHCALLAYEDFLINYDMAVLQIESKMHPSRAESVVMEMLDRTVGPEEIDLKFVTFRK